MHDTVVLRSNCVTMVLVTIRGPTACADDNKGHVGRRGPRFLCEDDSCELPLWHSG